jgi:hypothetical protein
MGNFDVASIALMAAPDPVGRKRAPGIYGAIGAEGVNKPIGKIPEQGIVALFHAIRSGGSQTTKMAAIAS